MKNLLVALFSVCLITGCINTSKSNRPLVILQPAPEFALKKVLGGEVKSQDLKGKVVVVDFWATWCVPCKVEIPQYNELQKKYKDKGVEFVGVTFDSGTADEIKPWVDELKIAYPVVMGTDSIDAALGGHPGIPTTFLIGKDWKVYRKIFGGSDKKIENIEKDILALLDKA